MGSSLVVQWLGLSAPTARDPGSVLGWGTKIPQALWLSKKKKKKNKTEKNNLIYNLEIMFHLGILWPVG